MVIYVYGKVGNYFHRVHYSSELTPESYGDLSMRPTASSTFSEFTCYPGHNGYCICILHLTLKFTDFEV